MVVLSEMLIVVEWNAAPGNRRGQFGRKPEPKT